MAESYNGMKGSPTIYGAASYFANNANFQTAVDSNFEIFIKGLRRDAANNVFTGKEAYNQAVDRIEGITTDADMGEIIRLNVIDVTLPDISIGEITLKHGNDRVKVAGAPDVGDVSITVHDVIGADTEQVLWGWFSLVYDVRSQMMGLAVDYKKEALLYQLAPDGSSVRTWQCVGLWPSKFPSKKFSYDSGKELTIDLELKCDNIYLIREEVVENEPNYAFGTNL